MLVQPYTPPKLESLTSIWSPYKELGEKNKGQGSIRHKCCGAWS
jgi:hypothetical protein